MCREKSIRNDGSKNHVKALHKFVKQGRVWAKAEMAVLYMMGIGVTQSLEKAKSLIEIAAKQGNANAQHNLADMYANGKGRHRDVLEAVKWFTKAADQGNMMSIWSLVDIHNLMGTEFVYTPKCTACGHCSKLHNPPTHTLKPCSQCKSIFYCDRECQSKDWKVADMVYALHHGHVGHKKWCKKLSKIKKCGRNIMDSVVLMETGTTQEEVANMMRTLEKKCQEEE